MNDITNGEVSTGQDVHTVRFLFVCVCIVAWWRDEAHQYPNISTHPLRLNMPKEKNPRNFWKEGQEKNNDHPLELNIPKCDQPKHPKIAKENFLQSKPRSKNTNWWSNSNTWPWVAVRGVLTNQQTCSEVLALAPGVSRGVALNSHSTPPIWLLWSSVPQS